MEKWTDGRELARFEKNSCEDVRLSLHKWTIGHYLDIRVWTKIRPTDDAPSNPTEQGLVLNIELLPDLRRAIDNAIVELGGEGKPAEAELVFAFDEGSEGKTS